MVWKLLKGFFSEPLVPEHRPLNARDCYIRAIVKGYRGSGAQWAHELRVLGVHLEETEIPSALHLVTDTQRSYQEAKVRGWWYSHVEWCDVLAEIVLGERQQAPKADLSEGLDIPTRANGYTAKSSRGHTSSGSTMDEASYNSSANVFHGSAMGGDCSSGDRSSDCGGGGGGSDCGGGGGVD